MALHPRQDLKRIYTIDVSEALPPLLRDERVGGSQLVEYRPCTVGQPYDMKIEELNALRDAKDAAAAQVTEEYMSNLTEGPPDEAAVQELQAEAKYLAVQRFTKFNSPRFVREYDREIELLVCVTMYNEDAEELDRTLVGLAQNIELLGFGLTWKNIAIIIIVDGYSKMNPTVESYAYRKLHLLVPGVMRPTMNGDNVTCHWFERTVQLTKHKTVSAPYPPMQTVLCVKQRNGGKLNSHLWFFRGFCELVQPRYTVLLDVGTVPHPPAIHRMYRAFEENIQIAGACGEIAVRQHAIYSSIISAQVFEYKMSHVLDKAMESVFGYITVLPGAFSAYRWEAIRNEPLHKYFKTEEVAVSKISAFEANMFLAEDRVLCLEVFAKKNRFWTLHYVAGAVADTDVPEDLISLIKQRRRWLNGAFFALMYFMLRYTGVIAHTDHSILRKIAFTFQFFYLVMLVVLNWLSPGAVYLSFFVIFNKTLEDFQLGQAFLFIFSLTYIFSFIIVVLAAIGSEIKSVYVFLLPSLVNVLPVYSFCNLHDISWGTKEGNLRAELAREADQRAAMKANLALLENPDHGEAKTKPDDDQSTRTADNAHMMDALNAESVYAKVGTDQVHEATVAQDLLKEELKVVQVAFKLFRLRLLSLWLACNFTFVLFIVQFNLLDHFLLVMLGLVLVSLGYRLVGSIMYQLLRMFKVAVRRCCRCCFDARRDLPSLTPAATADPKAEVQFADFLLNKRHRLSVNRRVDFEGKHGPGVEALRAVGEGVGHGEDGFLPVDEGSGGYDDGDGGGDGGDGFMTDAPTDSEFVTDDGAVMNGMVRASPQSDASEHRRRQVEHMESVIDLSDLAEEAAVATAAAQHAENRLSPAARFRSVARAVSLSPAARTSSREATSKLEEEAHESPAAVAPTDCQAEFVITRAASSYYEFSSGEDDDDDADDDDEGDGDYGDGSDDSGNSSDDEDSGFDPVTEGHHRPTTPPGSPPADSDLTVGIAHMSDPVSVAHLGTVATSPSTSSMVSASSLPPLASGHASHPPVTAVPVDIADVLASIDEQLVPDDVDSEDAYNPTAAPSSRPGSASSGSATTATATATATATVTDTDTLTDAGESMMDPSEIVAAVGGGEVARLPSEEGGTTGSETSSRMDYCSLRLDSILEGVDDDMFRFNQVDTGSFRDDATRDS